jgi:hypothetical protein
VHRAACSQTIAVNVSGFHDCIRCQNRGRMLH